MLIRRLSMVSALLALLHQDDPVAQQLRRRLHAHGRFPTHGTGERRLAVLPTYMPGLLDGVGRQLVVVLIPWAHHGRAAVVDSLPLRTSGGVGHRQHRQAYEIPHTPSDTAAGRSQSGWHGWWYGWKWHLAVAVGAAWIPVAADPTAANTADNSVASQLLAPLPAEVRDVLRDTSDHDPEVGRRCEQSDRA